MRKVYPLLDQLPNFHIDLSWTIVHFGLEDFVKRFGATRFLFGSRMPIFSAGPAICYLQYADISDEDKAMIARNNLCRLLDWNKTLHS
jgi:predicted TIM-barrel fold metal-dependent hydrolase